MAGGGHTVAEKTASEPPVQESPKIVLLARLPTDISSKANDLWSESRLMIQRQ